MQNTILFPTDFSKVSINAFRFAVDYAKKFDLTITVFHAYDDSQPFSDDMKKEYDEINPVMFQNKRDVFPSFETILNSLDSQNVVVKYVLNKGTFLETLNQFVERKDDVIEVLILGTHETKRNFFDFFVDNKTIKVLNQIKKPVVAVPENSHFDGNIDNLLFLTDYREGELNELEDLIVKTKQFGAMLHVLHIDLGHVESIVPLFDRFKNQLAKHDFSNVKFTVIDSIDFKKEVINYSEKNDIDLIYLMNQNRNYYQRLFTYSIAEELIKSYNKPIMAVYDEN